MASDKFGNNPVAPLYNATGRNPRDMDMGNPGKPLGSVGSSGIGGKDFGTPNKPPTPATLGATFGQWNNPLSVQGQMNNRLYGGGGGGGGREIDVEATERLWKAAPSTTINFGDAVGGDDNSVGRRASTGGGDITGKNKAGNDQYIDNEQTATITADGGASTTSGGTSKPAKLKTEAQKSRDRETAKARRALKSDIQKSGTTEQKERIAKEGLTGRKKSTTNTPSKRPASSPSSGPKKGNNVIQVQNSMGALQQKATVGNPGASDFKV